MKTLYLMRHGQTMFNVAHKIQGWCDAPLTDLGRAQAEVAGSGSATGTLLLTMRILPHLSGQPTPWKSLPADRCPTKGSGD